MHALGLVLRGLIFGGAYDQNFTVFAYEKNLKRVWDTVPGVVFVPFHIHFFLDWVCGVRSCIDL